jgi:hypothetical protein
VPGLGHEDLLVVLHERAQLVVLARALPVRQVADLVLALVLLALGLALVAHQRVAQRLEHGLPELVLLLHHLGPEAEHVVERGDAEQGRARTRQRRQHDLEDHLGVHERGLLQDHDVVGARASQRLDTHTHTPPEKHHHPPTSMAPRGSAQTVWKSERERERGGGAMRAVPVHHATREGGGRVSGELSHTWGKGAKKRFV